MRVGVLRETMRRLLPQLPINTAGQLERAKNVDELNHRMLQCSDLLTVMIDVQEAALMVVSRRNDKVVYNTEADVAIGLINEYIDEIERDVLWLTLDKKVDRLFKSNYNNWQDKVSRYGYLKMCIRFSPK